MTKCSVIIITIISILIGVVIFTDFYYRSLADFDYSLQPVAALAGQKISPELFFVPVDIMIIMFTAPIFTRK